MKNIFLILFVNVLISCGVSKKIAEVSDDQQIELTLVQVNDVYEIAPIAGGEFGGMARVAAIKKESLKSNPNTLLVMAGDFLSPSVYNSLKYENKRIRGRQMIEVMNATGFDFAIFGNHEFDITENELQERLNESTFQWISSNSFHRKGDSIQPFKKYAGNLLQEIPSKQIIRIKDADGTTARIGILGLTIRSNPAGYVYYTDPLETAKLIYNREKDSCDAVIAITHQEMSDDIILAKEIPTLTLIAGGHEHDMRFNKTGDVFITKAHSNARSAYIINIKIDKKNKSVIVVPTLKEIDRSVPMDSITGTVVNKWTEIANNSYRSIGFNPQQILIPSGDSLEAREQFTRTGSTNMTNLLVNSMKFASPASDIVVTNAGSIRLDDILYAPVSQYDILRSMPFGGSIREVEMKGSLLQQILQTGNSNRGTGGFLYYSSLSEEIDPDKTYKVALSDYLLMGKETNLEFLKESNPLITKVYPEITSITDPRSDVRLAIVKYLEQGR